MFLWISNYFLFSRIKWCFISIKQLFYHNHIISTSYSSFFRGIISYFRLYQWYLYMDDIGFLPSSVQVGKFSRTELALYLIITTRNPTPTGLSIEIFAWGGHMGGTSVRWGGLVRDSQQNLEMSQISKKCVKKDQFVLICKKNFKD